jgi:hypothetical protein
MLSAYGPRFESLCAQKHRRGERIRDKAAEMPHLPSRRRPEAGQAGFRLDKVLVRETVGCPSLGAPIALRGHAPLGDDDVKVGDLNVPWRAESDFSVESSPTEAVRQRPSRVGDSASCSPCGAEGDYLLGLTRR